MTSSAPAQQAHPRYRDNTRCATPARHGPPAPPVAWQVLVATTSANLLVTMVARLERWPASMVVWPFWVQRIALSLGTCVRLRKAGASGYTVTDAALWTVDYLPAHSRRDDERSKPAIRVRPLSGPARFSQCVVALAE